MTYSVKHFRVLLKIKRYINEFIIFINAKYKKRYILDIHINVLYTCTKQLKTFKPCLVYVVYIIKYWKKNKSKINKFSIVSISVLFAGCSAAPNPDSVVGWFQNCCTGIMLSNKLFFKSLWYLFFIFLFSYVFSGN